MGQVCNLQAGLQPAFRLRAESFSTLQYGYNGPCHSHGMERRSCRRLPHLYIQDQPTFITWRLFGSLPPSRVFPAKTSSGRTFVAMDSILDRGRTGPLYLRRPELARLTVNAIQYAQDHLQLYRLHAYAVMPNHVHLLLTPLADIARITQSVKRFTAREANRLLGLTGQPFWQDESFDHVVRNTGEFGRIAAYVENNPVRAGLAAEPADFEWSSAKSRLQTG